MFNKQETKRVGQSFQKHLKKINENNLVTKNWMNDTNALNLLFQI